jgi:hypothetical protein
MFCDSYSSALLIFYYRLNLYRVNSTAFLIPLIVWFNLACNLKDDKDMFYALDVLSSSSSNSTTDSSGLSLSGTSSGLSGTIVLLLNNSESLTITNNGTFVFTSRFSKDKNYSITIQSEPSTQDCSLANETGVFNSDNISNIALTCITSSDKRIFLTLSTFSGNLQGVEANGILGADAKCEVDGNKPATGTFKAFLVDGVNRRVCTSHNCGTDGALENLNWVLKKNTKYIRISDSGEIFTTNNRRMFIFGTATNPFNLVMVNTWTGIAQTIIWGSSSLNCNNWTNNTNAERGTTGTSTSTDYTLIRDATLPNCDQSNHLICVEQ